MITKPAKDLGKRMHNSTSVPLLEHLIPELECHRHFVLDVKTSIMYSVLYGESGNIVGLLVLQQN